MARQRKKKHTHVGATNGPKNGVKPNTSAARNPKSMVVRIGAGEVGPSVSQLVKDVRAMLEPDTASRLKVSTPSIWEIETERRRNENRTNYGTTPPWSGP